MPTRTETLPSRRSPDEALQILREGNARFVNNLKANRDLLQQVRATREAQYPFAVVLSCMDSRTSTELIFDQGIGDIFSIRIAGNCVNEDILGSMEFACKVSGSVLILVLGHTGCGAIKGACDDVRMGNLTTLLNKIRPAVDDTPSEGPRTSENGDFVEAVCRRNVRHSVDEITQRSPILKELLATGAIAIAGGIYDIGAGEVTFLDVAVSARGPTRSA